jgi:hypothetical protein
MAAKKKPMVKIAKSKKGTFTAAAKKSGMSVQQKATAVLKKALPINPGLPIYPEFCTFIPSHGPDGDLGV